MMFEANLNNWRQRGAAWSCLALMVVYPAIVEAKCTSGDKLAPGDHVYDIDFGGRSRTFTLHVPAKYDGLKPVALVFDLHGFSSSGPGQLSISGFQAVSEMHNFLVVAPTGYMNSWNGDIAYGAAYGAKLDDVGLMKAIVEYVANIANIDRARVFSTGLSNGAAMSNTLGCQAADTFAAVAPVADPLDIGIPTCKPAQPISVLGFHGYSDEYVPYEGGPGGGPRLPTPFPSIPDTLKAWGTIMGCTGAPELISFQGMNKCEIYRDCNGEAQVGYCSLEGGHVLYSQNNLDIADYAWKFFATVSLAVADADDDEIGDADDNCVHVANADQADSNANCVGDACECATQAECDDGSFCNGAEACMAGVCGPGTAACQASERCDEALDQCAGASITPTAGTAAGSVGAAANGGMTGGSAGTGAAGAAATSGAPVGPSAGSPASPIGGAAGAGAPANDNSAPQSASNKDDGGGCRAMGNARGSTRALPTFVLLLSLGLFVTRLSQRRRSAPLSLRKPRSRTRPT